MNLRLKSAKIRCGIEFRLTKKWLKVIEFEDIEIQNLKIDKIEYEIKNDESLKMKFLGQRTSNEDTRGY